ncbi:SPOR domain-containing protein [Herminiimonas sp. NPDC097707]|uniref:SPOR domain-containing protein n=1 Tax=Herminiimonas sp. NPDC097707 TaxID=3364007 RepID=UPI003839EA6E
MLKILFGFLLLINGGLYAFQQGWLDAWSPASREPSRLTQQLNPAQLKLIPLPAAQPAAVAPSVVNALAAVTPVTPQEPEAEKNTARADKISNVLACTEVGNFDAVEAKRFETQLASLALGERLTRRTIQEHARHMVYMPPQASKDAAEKKAGELKRLGVEDFFVIQDGSPLQWGISLGIFKSEEAARNHLNALNQKGVRSARIGTHSPSANKVAFQLRGLDATAKNSVVKIKGSFPRQELRECTGPVAG